MAGKINSHVVTRKPTNLDDYTHIKWWLVLCVLAWLLVRWAPVTVEADAADQSSGPRKAKIWFLFPRTVTKYLREKTSIVATVTSSCVVVQQSLPRCRNARHTRIRPTATLQMEKTSSAELVEGIGSADASEFLFGSGAFIEDARLVEEENGDEPLSWAEYFGVEAVTVTKTLVHSVTVKYQDPSTVIAFDVKGCRPTDLPFNLPLCSRSSTSINLVDNNTSNSASTRSINTLTKAVHYVP